MNASPRSLLGIDFGTSHTVAIVRRPDGRVEPLLFDGSPLLPSAVFAGRDGLLVGRDAVDSARTGPQSFEPNPKRRIDDGSILLGERDVPVVDVFAAVLSRVRQEAVTVLGGAPDRVALTYPASWGSARRLALRDAAIAADLPEPVLVPEPVAAATYFARHLEHDIPDGAAVVVHDFGGGTFDASVVRRDGDGFEVLSVDGLDDLGGVDIDAAIVDHLRARFDDGALWRRLLEPETPNDRRARRTFLDDVRSAKERLSRQTSADVYLPLFDVDVHLTREELEGLTGPMLDRAVRLVHAVVRASGVAEGAMAGLFLVGGASRMPLVATMLHRALGTPPVVVDQIEQVVAHGALLAAETAAGPGPLTPPVGPIAPVTPPPSMPPPVESFLSDPTSAPSAPYVSPVATTTPTSSPPTPSAPTGPSGWPDPVTIVPNGAPPPPPTVMDGGMVGRLAAGGAVLVILVAALFVLPSLFGADDGETPPGGSTTNPGGLGTVEEDDTQPGLSYDSHQWSIEAMTIVDLDGRAAVVSGAHTDPIRVWDAETGDDIAEFEGHDQTHDSISAIESTMLDGRPAIVSTGWGTEILVWDPATGEEIRDIQIPDGDVITIIGTGVYDGDPVVVTATGCGCGDSPATRVRVWNLADGRLVCEWEAGIETATVHVADVDGTPRVVLSGIDADGAPEIQIRAFGDGELIDRASPKGEPEDIAWYTHSAVAGTGEPTVLTAAPGAPVEVWDATSGKSSSVFTRHGDAVESMDVVRWGDRLVAVTGDASDVFYVWDVATGEVLLEKSFDDITTGVVGFTSGLTTVAAGVVGDRLTIAVSAFISFQVYTWSFEA